MRESFISWLLGAEWRGGGGVHMTWGGSTLNVAIDGPFLASLGANRWRRITSKDPPAPVEQSTGEGAPKEAPENRVRDLYVRVLGQFHGINTTQTWHLLEYANWLLLLSQEINWSNHIDIGDDKTDRIDTHSSKFWREKNF